MTFSTVARNPLQDADDVSLLPAIDSALGLDVPVPRDARLRAGAPQLLPLTHFVVLVRGVLLKGAPIEALSGQVWPIVAFMLVVLAIGLRIYRSALD